MKFGKLADISEVTFALPEDSEQNSLVLKQYKTTNSPRLYVGCTGWSMKEWKGKVYPNKAKAKDYLKYYGEQFNTIELNTTHYRIPEPSLVDKWYRETPNDFRFCPKLPQTISHRRGLGVNSDAFMYFCKAISGLKEKLGCCFMQLPPYFSTEYFAELQRFLEAFPVDIPLAVEFRHESWFRSSLSFEPVAQLLHKYNKSSCITDVAGRRDVLHNRLTNNTAMIRFVGNDLHSTDYERLDAWIAQLKKWIHQGLSEIYFFPHEPDNLRAPEAARYFVDKAKKDLEGVLVRGPKFVTEDTIGKQISLF